MLESLALVWLLGCTTEVPDTAAEPMLPPLDAPRWLRRASLEVRGVLPSIEELDAVEADPDALATLVEGYLDDERFSERFVRLQAERWHTRIDAFQIPYEDYFLEEDEDYRYARSIGEEPLRLMAWVAANDLSWTEVVTADYTVANDLLAEIWDLDRVEGEARWRPATYGDGRPAAGVLATNGLWWRYVTNLSNLNRSRAAAISRLLLCSDYLSRPISVSAEAAEDAAAAVRTEPGCVGCHASLDPMAAVLFGFTNTIQYNPPEMDTYHPEREVLGEQWLEVAPAYFGSPLEGLHDLGTHIASDPRFVRCTAQSTAELLLHRPTDAADHDTITELSELLVDEDLRIKPVMLEVLLSEEYGAAAVEEGHPLSSVALVVRQLGPDLLASSLEALLGLSWEWEGYAVLDSDGVGLRVLGGGVDGDMITSAQQEPGLTWSLVVERTAEAAAQRVVEQELVQEGDRTFFPDELTLEHRPGDEVFEDTLGQLWWRLYAERPTEAELAELGELHDAVRAFHDDPATAWEAVIVAMLRDPAWVTY